MYFGASSYALCIRNNFQIYAGHLLEYIVFCFTFVTCYVRSNRNSRWRMFFKIGVFKNRVISTTIHLCLSLFNYITGTVAAPNWTENHFEKFLC